MEGCLLFLVFIFALLCGVVYILPYVVPVVIVFIVIVLICFCVQMEKIKRAIKNITEEPFETCKIKPFVQYTTEELISKFGLYNNSKYFKYFSQTVRKNGEIYFYEDRIDKYECIDNIHKCKLIGSKEYDVLIEIDKNGQIINKECNCQGFKSGYNCKHIYALLYSLNCSKNKEKIISTIEKELIPFAKEMMNRFENYLPKLSKHSTVVLETSIKTFNSNLNNYQNMVKEAQTEEKAFNIAKRLYNMVYDVRLSILSILQVYEKNSPIIYDEFYNDKIFAKQYNKSKSVESEKNNEEYNEDIEEYEEGDFWDSENFGKFLLERKKIKWIYGGEEPTDFEKGLIMLNHIIDEEEKEKKELERILSDAEEDDDEF